MEGHKIICLGGQQGNGSSQVAAQNDVAPLVGCEGLEVGHTSESTSIYPHLWENYSHSDGEPGTKPRDLPTLEPRRCHRVIVQNMTKREPCPVSLTPFLLESWSRGLV